MRARFRSGGNRAAGMRGVLSDHPGISKSWKSGGDFYYSLDRGELASGGRTVPPDTFVPPYSARLTFGERSPFACTFRWIAKKVVPLACQCPVVGVALGFSLASQWHARSQKWNDRVQADRTLYGDGRAHWARLPSEELRPTLPSPRELSLTPRTGSAKNRPGCRW
jgi:hypothetical protein